MLNQIFALKGFQRVLAPSDPICVFSDDLVENQNVVLGNGGVVPRVVVLDTAEDPCHFSVNPPTPKGESNSIHVEVTLSL